MCRDIVWSNYQEGCTKILKKIEQMDIDHKMALSSDGRLLATISQRFRDGKEDLLTMQHKYTIRIWDLATESCIATFRNDFFTLNVAFSSDSDLLLVGGNDFWNIYHVSSQRLIACNREPATTLPRQWFKGLSAFNNANTSFAVSRGGWDSTRLLFFSVNSLWKQLTELLRGRLSLEKVMFILFMRELKHEGLTLARALPALSEKFQLSVKTIRSSLMATYKSFLESEKRYIFQLQGTPNVTQELK